MNAIIAATNSESAGVVLTLFLMLLAAKLFAEIFERLNQPGIVGEILAGIVLGSSVLGWVAPTEVTAAIAEIGVIFLLFAVGLETKPAALLRVGKTSLIVAVLGVVLPFIGGWLLMRLWGETGVVPLFVGTAMVATSVGITARVLSAIGKLNAPAAQVILGAAVIDDILALLVLAGVSSIAAGQLDIIALVTTAALAVVFTFGVIFIGARIVTRFAPRIEALRIERSLFLGGVVLCLGLSVAAAYIGVAAIIGAFLAGMALAEVAEGESSALRLETEAVTEFLAPFFLVQIGLQLDLAVFRDTNTMLLAVLITLIAVATKFAGCGLGAWSLGRQGAAQVGVGMMPRGEVGIVVAQIGLTLGVINAKLYGVVLFMAIATTLIAPPLLKRLFASEDATVARE